MKQWMQTNEGKLGRLKMIGQRRGWVVIELSEDGIRMFKDHRNNLHVNIEGEIEFLYNINEHSVTTTLNHNGKVKTLRGARAYPNH